MKNTIPKFGAVIINKKNIYFSGIATGALLFVVIFEVIHLEKSKINVSGLLQFGAILFGFVVTVLIKILSGKYLYNINYLLY